MKGIAERRNGIQYFYIAHRFAQGSVTFVEETGGDSMI